MGGWKLNLCLGLAVTAYLVIGGAIFHALESTTEETIRKDTSNFTRKFLEEKPCMSHEDLVKLTTIILEAYEAGIIVTNTSSPANWDVASSIFFAATVITTIGYGHISPVTGSGRAFFTVYAILGIPLCLIFLAGIGAALKKSAIKLDEKLSICKKNPKLGKVLRATIIITVGLVLFIFIPSIIFSALEDWSYGTSLYYSVVSLSTVGFGDYVASQMSESDARPFYRLSVCIWLFIGLAWLATIMGLIQEMMESLVSKASERAADVELVKKEAQNGESNEKADEAKEANNMNADSNSKTQSLSIKL